MLTKTIGQLSAATSITGSDLFEIEQSGTSKYADISMIASPIIGNNDKLRGYIDGLILTNATDTEHDITIAAGVARDSTNAYILLHSTPITKRIDAAWTAGSDSGGLDTGSVATSLTYYVYLIQKDSDSSTDGLFSLSATAPTMPSGYTYFRRIGSLLTDGSANIRNFIQTQDMFIFKSFVLSRSHSTAGVTTRSSITTHVPPSMVGIYTITASVPTGGNYMFVSSLDDTDIAPSSYDTCSYVCSTTSNASGQLVIKTNSSSQIGVRTDNVNYYFGIKTLGWFDNRGKNQ